MEDLYREHLLDHYENPRHRGTLDPADISHEESNPLCGDTIRIDIRLGEDGRRIDQIAFSGDGCIISQAAASMLLEEIAGKSIEDAQKLETQDVLKLVGVPLTTNRVKCAALSLKVLKAGIYRYLIAQAQKREREKVEG
ncbi:MAG: SUF system NifU family Fe-S cluster assembly protein [Anaerolineae bacterium]|nr:SUF system NifU family Fe-S cluster assembly protein [Thermoflexales bacterium]MDW8406797.1 SUF system NifU family Fe-S cluster assembly protein [Anaerolineae bacterium]